MVFMLDSLPTEREHQEFLSYKMIGNTFTWWQGVEASLDEAQLVSMIVQEFREIFEELYILDMTRELMRDLFKKLR